MPSSSGYAGPVSAKDMDAMARAAMLRHPSEPYLPFMAAVRAVHERDDDPIPWLGATLERARVYGPAHLVLARVVAARSPSQARLEYRLAMEQAPNLVGTVMAGGLPTRGRLLRRGGAPSAGQAGRFGERAPRAGDPRALARHAGAHRCRRGGPCADGTRAGVPLRGRRGRRPGGGRRRSGCQGPCSRPRDLRAHRAREGRSPRADGPRPLRGIWFTLQGAGPRLARTANAVGAVAELRKGG